MNMTLLLLAALMSSVLNPTVPMFSSNVGVVATSFQNSHRDKIGTPPERAQQVGMQLPAIKTVPMRLSVRAQKPGISEDAGLRQAAKLVV